MRHFIWFKRWIEEGYTLRQLARQSGHSVSTIRRVIEYWLGREPEQPARLLADCASAIVDGTFIYRRKGLLAVMDTTTRKLLYGVYNVSESPHDLKTFFGSLAERGLSLKYATIDGHPALNNALRRQWPLIVLQRCLVHIQRQGLSWCRRSPKRIDAKHLREIFLAVTAIRSASDRDVFLEHVHSWEETYGIHIAATAERGHIFSDLKRARSMLVTALPDMFHYLDNPLIANSTNALEGYFSRVKQRYRQHRGLAQRHRQAYFRWFFSLCPR